MPTSGSFLQAGQSSFAKRSVRGRVSKLLVGIECAQALSLTVNPMPPRITEQSYRPRVSDRTMVATCTCNRFACCASEIDVALHLVVPSGSGRMTRHSENAGKRLLWAPFGSLL